jgi:hypothetical protein
MQAGGHRAIHGQSRAGLGVLIKQEHLGAVLCFAVQQVEKAIGMVNGCSTMVKSGSLEGENHVCCGPLRPHWLSSGGRRVGVGKIEEPRKYEPIVTGGSTHA